MLYTSLMSIYLPSRSVHHLVVAGFLYQSVAPVPRFSGSKGRNALSFFMYSLLGIRRCWYQRIWPKPVDFRYGSLMLQGRQKILLSIRAMAAGFACNVAIPKLA